MATVREVLVPDIGEFADVPVIEILVAPGDSVALEDPLVTLESDKATMDIPAPFAGVVGELRVVVGQRVSEGSPLLTLAIDSDAATPVAAAPADPLPGGDPAIPHASPSVRRLARESGVDLGAIAGSGRKGRVLPEDVVRHLDGGGPGRVAAVAGSAASGWLELAPWPRVEFAEFGPIESVPLARIKRIAGPYLHRNWVAIPHVTHHDEADITELEAFRVQSNERLAGEGVKLTMVALLLKACAATLREFPEFNASLDGESLILKRYYHLGFAADTPQGLVVPVIRDVDAKGLVAIAGDLRELSARAREGKLTNAEMQGGTFTISSLGGIGGTAFTPIVNAPEVAILGVTRAAFKPVWGGSEFRPRLMLGLSLSYDHRVIDGAGAARFTVHLASVLEDIRRVLL